MGENIDEAKGRAKQAAGDLTDDDSLKNEGPGAAKRAPRAGRT